MFVDYQYIFENLYIKFINYIKYIKKTFGSYSHTEGKHGVPDDSVGHWSLQTKVQTDCPAALGNY